MTCNRSNIVYFYRR